MAARYDTITFLSDYGTADEFVGVVQSVIRSIAPARRRSSTSPTRSRLRRAGRRPRPRPSHAVPLPRRGAGRGRPRRRHRPAGGRGRGRATARATSSAPTTACSPPAVAMCGGATAAVELTNTEYHLPAPGPTFAGRDVFAPAAAHLCDGVPLDELGQPDRPASLSARPRCPLTREEDGALVAEVLWVDRYGNAQLNVDPDEIADLGPRDPAPVGRRRPHRQRRTAPTRASSREDRPGRRHLRAARRRASGALGRRRARARRRHRGPPPAEPAPTSPSRTLTAQPVTLTPRSQP